MDRVPCPGAWLAAAACQRETVGAKNAGSVHNPPGLTTSHERSNVVPPKVSDSAVVLHVPSPARALRHFCGNCSVKHIGLPGEEPDRDSVLFKSADFQEYVHLFKKLPSSHGMRLPQVLVDMCCCKAVPRCFRQLLRNLRRFRAYWHRLSLPAHIFT